MISFIKGLKKLFPMPAAGLLAIALHCYSPFCLEYVNTQFSSKSLLLSLACFDNITHVPP